MLGQSESELENACRSKCPGASFSPSGAQERQQSERSLGDIHAIQHVLGVSGRRNLLQESCRRIIDQELNVIVGDPLEVNTSHSRWVAEHTLLRVIDHLRAGVGSDADLAADKYQNRFRLLSTLIAPNMLTWPTSLAWRVLWFSCFSLL